jgi:predicted RNase H-like HicB family nuclease
METQKKDLSYYLSLPYTIKVTRDNDEENPGWVARVVELSGCITQWDTFEELGEMKE